MKTRLLTAMTLFTLMALVTACRGSADDAKPSVKVLSPPDQHTIALARLIQFIFLEDRVCLFLDVFAATFDDDQFDLRGSHFFGGCNFSIDPVLFFFG